MARIIFRPTFLTTTFLIFALGASTLVSTSAEVEAATTTPGPAASPALQATIDGVLAGQVGTFGIAVRNLTTDETVLEHGNDFFPSASLYKLAVMYEAYRQNALNELSGDETLTISDYDVADGADGFNPGDQLSVRQALELMINQSNNTAARALGDRVGWDQLNQSMADLGLNQTRLPVGAWLTQVDDWRSQDSSTSPADMLSFFDRLYHGQLINPSASADMLNLLANQQINDRIPAELPPGTRVAHKTGNLDGIVNDAGIVFGPRADFILVMVSDDVDEAAATQAEADLSKALWDRFEAPNGGTTAPSTVPPTSVPAPVVPPTPVPVATAAPAPKITVSSNPNAGVVPNLLGVTEAVAQSAIEQSGLKTTYVNHQTLGDVVPANRAYFQSFAPGTVVSQSPPPGTTLPRGTPVYLAVRES